MHAQLRAKTGGGFQECPVRVPRMDVRSVGPATAYGRWAPFIAAIHADALRAVRRYGLSCLTRASGRSRRR